jgi:hypothetical protein
MPKKKSVRKPYEGKPHVRFDEGGRLRPASTLPGKWETLEIDLQWESKNTCQAFSLAASGTPKLLSLALKL